MAGKKTQAQLTPEEKLQQALVPEAEQPYKVPANWCWTRQNVACYLSDIEKFVNGEHPYLEAKFLRGLKKPKIVSAGKFINKLSKVILVDGENSGEVFDIFVDGYMGSTFRLLCFSEIVYEQYCRYFIIINKEIYSKSKKGSAIPHLNKELFFNMPFPLPPLTEQQRIVERIESLFAKLDEAKENLQNVLEGFETRKAAILHKAFTGELTANWRKQHGVSMDSWEEKTLNDIASYKKGPFGSSITKAMFVPKTANTYKVYEQGNVIRKDLTYGHYYITSEKYQELKGFSVKAGDILISCAGTIGEVYKLPPECEEGVINQALMRVRLNQNIIEGYFCYYFGEIIKDDVIDKSNGTAMKNIPPFKVLKAIQIKLPTINEQTEIVRIVDNLLAKEQKAHSIAQNALAKIDLIKKSILVRAFRGQLATNNPADESAVELLKRVL